MVPRARFFLRDYRFADTAPGGECPPCKGSEHIGSDSVAEWEIQ